MSGTLVHLVRHGAHGLVGRVLAGRMPGVRLSAEGVLQGKRVADALATRAIAAVLSSPQPRAEQTAALIAARHGLPVEIEHGLDEVDFGTWQGVTFGALDGQTAWQAWNRARGLATTPGGETMVQVQARALAVLARARAKWPGGEVVLAGHQDVLRAALLGVLGAPLDLFGRLAFAPGGRATVRLWDEHAELETLDNGL
ncbi:MAG: histidine phosphatase family protein [Acetobacteraceae bacterium]|nr:histidine phosphatase family protein [Acetobacteraceae bacterium]